MAHRKCVDRALLGAIADLRVSRFVGRLGAEQQPRQAARRDK
jgi:hypothetical protein